MPINKEGIPKYRTSPTGASQSDASIVVKVEDLIDMAMGPTDKNTVNFKIIQTLLHILARNMRLLDQQVELRSSDVNLPHLSTKERDKASRPDRAKAVEPTSRRKEQPERYKDKERSLDEIQVAKSAKGAGTAGGKHLKEKEIPKYGEKESPSSSSSVKDSRDNDESKSAKKKERAETDTKTESLLADFVLKQDLPESDLADSDQEKESTWSETDTEPFEIEIIAGISQQEHDERRAKMKIIRKVYLREKTHPPMSKIDEVKDKNLKDMDENQRAKLGTLDSDRTERDDKDKSEQAQLGAKSIKKEERELDEKERAKGAQINDMEGEIYFKETEKVKLDEERRHRARDRLREDTYTEIEREQYQKEMEKLANMDDEQRENYFKDKEEREKASFDAQDRESAGREINEREKAKIAKFYEKQGRKHLKQNERKEEEKSNILERERAEKEIDQKEKAKLDKKGREREDRDKELKREQYQKEMEKLDNMDDETREKYLRDKEEEEKSDIDAQDRERARIEMDAREKAKLANMDDETRAKYLKDKEEREKADIDAQNRERAANKMDSREKAKLANMDDEARSKYFRDTEEREKANFDAQDRERAGRELDDKEQTEIAKLNEKEKRKYLNQDEREEIEKSKLHALDRTSEEREIHEKEKAKKEQMNDAVGTKNLEKIEKSMLDTKEREREDGHKIYQKETENLANMDDEQREKYFKDKLESKEADFDAQDRERAGREMDEREKAKIANLNQTERGKYLKQDKKEEKVKSKIGALDREVTEREIDEKGLANMALVNETESKEKIKQKEKANLVTKDREIEDIDKEIEREQYQKEMEKLEKMDDETREKYLKDREVRAKADIDAQERERAKREIDTKENDKLANMDDETRTKYLKDKEQREKADIDAQNRERAAKKMDAREKAKLANMDDETRAKYLKDKEEREKADIDAQERERVEKKMDAREKAKLASMDDEARAKYFKEMGEKTDIGAQDRERAGREMDAREKAKLANMDDETRAKYFKDKEERERKEKANIDAQNRENKGKQMDEREKAEIAKLNETERGKYLKQGEKESREKSKLDTVDRERAEREGEKERERKEEIDKNLKEKDWVKGKVGSGTRTPGVDSRTRIGSIEVVTRSEFEILEARVNELQDKTVPIPYPTMPDNQKLRTDLASGSATLTDTMEAMHVSARVQAAESAMGLMAELLTQLAAAGALPKDLVEKLGEVTAGLSRPASAEATGDLGRDTSKSTTTKPNADVKSARSVVIPIEKGERSVGTVMDERIRSVATDINVRIGSVGVGTAIGKSAHSGVRTTTDGLSRHYVGMSLNAEDDVGPKKYSGVNAEEDVGSKKYFGVTTASKAHFIKSYVTHPELDDAQRELKDSMIKRANDMALKALRLGEIADLNVRRVADQMTIVSRVSTRISELFSLINDYADQLAGFDAGVSTQLQNFHDQIFQIKCELNDGIALFNQQIANPETEAVKELNTRYEDLVIDLDKTRHTLDKLGYYQNAIGDEVMTLLKSVEALREAKADRDELLDGIRDKADKVQLEKLIRGPDFEAAKMKMDQRLDECDNKFDKQEQVWMTALEDLNTYAVSKASGDSLFNFTYKTEMDLNKIKDEVQLLSTAIGEPMAILLTRKISEGGTCGPCQAPARQEPTADPQLLPAMRRHPPVEEEPCKLPVKQPRQLDEREHICKRWTGGSHTLLNKSVVQQNSEAIRMYMPPTKKYAGIGKDGKMYQLEEMLQPCVDCNQLGVEETMEEGAGEPGVKKVLLNFNEN